MSPEKNITDTPIKRHFHKQRTFMHNQKKKKTNKSVPAVSRGSAIATALHWH